ncbi:MAG TPA: 2-oxoglutarate dehydrogenase complex dihydrolipoyllysine-residue succinyltransferase [Verrucomicrobiae bacterium]|nr:2-oxoglutarate dehydrogenase complex dihydrolipoyllysine-residue succinyltransferase [Verrucomicrobiae bacterium]
MAIELKVPAVGESITEVEIGDWLKPEGATVQRDENVVLLESEKATVELPAPAAGRISKILKQKGQTASVGETIGYIEAVEAKSKPAPAPTAPAKSPAPPVEAKKEPSKVPGNGGHEREQLRRPNTPPPTVQEPQHETVWRPQIITQEQEEPQQRAQEAEPEPQPQAQAQPKPQRETQPGREEEVVRMSPLRRAVAKHLVEAQQTAALLTTFNEVDMSAVMALRKEFQPAFQEKYGIKLGMMSFFVKAAIEALKAVPQVNAEVRGNDIVYHNYFDIGVAVGGGKGLVVPVIRNAERLSFAEIEKAIAEFATRAKDNKLKPDELEAGTFTISNGGVFGSLLSTPIVNPPQSGILGLHAIQDRPVARDGNVVIRPMMYVALTYDHRIVDGREAVTFLKRIKDLVESPPRILLEV